MVLKGWFVFLTGGMGEREVVGNEWICGCGGEG